MKKIIKREWEKVFNNSVVTHETMMDRVIVESRRERMMLKLECGHSTAAKYRTILQKSTRCYECEPVEQTEEQYNKFDALNDQLRLRIAKLNENDILSKLLEQVDDIRYDIQQGYKIDTSRLEVILEEIKECKKGVEREDRD